MKDLFSIGTRSLSLLGWVMAKSSEIAGFGVDSGRVVSSGREAMRA